MTSSLILQPLKTPKSYLEAKLDSQYSLFSLILSTLLTKETKQKLGAANYQSKIVSSF